VKLALNPIIRDRAGALEPIPAAIAAITGQPLTAVVRVLRECLEALRSLVSVGGTVDPEDACHAALLRFGFAPSRLYVDAQRRTVPGEVVMGDLLNAYARSPGQIQRLFVIAKGGAAYAFLGNRVSSSHAAAPTTLTAMVRAGALSMDEPVRFAMTFILKKVVPPVAPDHKFLESVAIPAFALAEAYNIEVLPVEWPYWNLSFPGEMTDGMPGSGDTLVCGEHELLCTINDRVRQHEGAAEQAADLIASIRSKG